MAPLQISSPILGLRMIPSREDRGGAGEARGVLEMGRLSAAASSPLFFLALPLLLSCTVKPVSEWIQGVPHPASGKDLFPIYWITPPAAIMSSGSGLLTPPGEGFCSGAG